MLFGVQKRDMIGGWCRSSLFPLRPAVLCGIICLLKTGVSKMSIACRTLLLLVLTGLGCGAPKVGHLQNTTTSYMSQREFMFVDSVTASSQSYSLLCLIDLSPDNYPYRDNMKSLHKQADLKPNQALVNFRKDHKC